MYENILVPLDGSELAEAAIQVAVAISKASGARLCLVHVEDTGPIGRAPTVPLAHSIEALGVPRGAA